MNNIDVDNVRCDKDEYGNLFPYKSLIDLAAQQNSRMYFKDSSLTSPIPEDE